MTRLLSLPLFYLLVAAYTAQTVLVTAFTERLLHVSSRGGGNNVENKRRGGSSWATIGDRKTTTNPYYYYNRHPWNSVIASNRYLFTSTKPCFNIVALSSSAGTTVLDNDEALPAETPANTIKQKRMFSKRILLARVLLFAAVFLSGYGIGVNTNTAGSKGIASPRASARRYVFLTAGLLFFVARDVWRSVPMWAKPTLLERAAADTAKLFGVEDANNNNGDSLSSSRGYSDDLSDFDTLVGKLGGMLAVAKRKLSVKNKGLDFRASFFAMIRIIGQLKKKESTVEARDKLYSQSRGTPTTFSDLKRLDLYMDMADWAYDEADRPLEELLEEQGYALLKHDKTALPGYLGHYLAISRTNKTAIIGVRGTSSLEDLITDMCGQAVSYNDLPASPFPKEGWEDGTSTTTTLRCHEGILFSSLRLADDLQPFVEDLLLPQGYNITVVGHSLGAASAAMLGVFLRSRIPSLVSEVGRLRVLAFASPPILDLENALACSSFCTTIVNNCDIIPRCNIFPLLVTVEILKEIPERLDDKLLSAEELTDAINTAIGEVDLADEDHLYVPGKVILMYNQWKKEEGKNVDAAAAADVAVVTDGTAKLLRYLPFDERLVKDHDASSYKASLRSLLDRC